MVNEHAVRICSDIIGWMYFFAWSASFYPQSATHIKNENVGGFSIEYAFLNPSGYLFYSTYSVAGRIDANVGIGTVTN